MKIIRAYFSRVKNQTIHRHVVDHKFSKIPSSSIAEGGSSSRVRLLPTKSKYIYTHAAVDDLRAYEVVARVKVSK